MTRPVKRTMYLSMDKGGAFDGDTRLWNRDPIARGDSAEKEVEWIPHNNRLTGVHLFDEDNILINESDTLDKMSAPAKPFCGVQRGQCKRVTMILLPEGYTAKIERVGK